MISTNRLAPQKTPLPGTGLVPRLTGVGYLSYVISLRHRKDGGSATLASSASARENDILVGSDPPHVEHGIAHASKGRIDADPGCFGDFLEAHIAIEAHVKHFALRFGKGIHYAAHISIDLPRHKHILYILLAKVAAIEHIGVVIVDRYGVLAFFLTEIIDNKVVGNPRDPCRKLPGISIPTLTDGHDGLHESLLEYIIGNILYFDDVEYIGEHAVLMPAKQCVEGGVVTVCVGGHQFFISEPCHLLHCVVKKWVKIK